MIVIKTLFHALIFPGLLFSFAFGLFLTGINRKVIARMQRRVGAPIVQPFYDFFKLIGKENIIPKMASRKIFIISPIIAVVSVVTAELFIPIFGVDFFSSNNADSIVVLYLLIIPTVALIAGGLASGSLYSNIGASREMVTMLSYMLPLIIIFLAIGTKAGFSTTDNITFSLNKICQYQASNGAMVGKLAMIPAAIAFLFIIPAEVGVTPFDTAEANTEICEGLLADYTGFYLAMYKLMKAIKIFVMGSLFVALFIGGVMVKNIFLNIIIVIVLITLVMLISISLSKAALGRIRNDQVLKFFWTIPTVLATISLVLAYLKI